MCWASHRLLRTRCLSGNVQTKDADREIGDPRKTSSKKCDTLRVPFLFVFSGLREILLCMVCHLVASAGDEFAGVERVTSFSTWAIRGADISSSLIPDDFGALPPPNDGPSTGASSAFIQLSKIIRLRPAEWAGTAPPLPACGIPADISTGLWYRRGTSIIWPVLFRRAGSLTQKEKVPAPDGGRGRDF